MAKIKTPNTAPLGLYPIKDLPRGEYVRRVDVCKHCRGEGAAKPHTYGHRFDRDGICGTCDGSGFTKIYPTTWIKGEYCRSFPYAGRYELTDFEGVDRTCYLSVSVLVLAGFTF